MSQPSFFFPKIGPDVRPKQAGIRLYRCQVPAMLQAGGFPPQKTGRFVGRVGARFIKAFRGHETSSDNGGKDGLFLLDGHLKGTSEL